MPRTRTRPRPVQQPTIETLPRVAGPDATPVPYAALRVGVRLGWLTIEKAALSPHDRIQARCDCGTVLTPYQHLVARGSVRSCGSATLHGVWG